MKGEVAMSVVSIFGHDAEAEARAFLKVSAWCNRQAAQPMREADRLLQTILEAGDLVGQDDAGRMVIQLAVEPLDFDRLMAFGADAVEAEDGGDDEPYQCSPMSPCWFWEGGPRFLGLPLDQQIGESAVMLGRGSRLVQALALALLVLMAPSIAASADQNALIAALPMMSTAPAPRTPMPTSTATAEAPQQCCRMCKKGKPCGDGCISTTKQCKKEQGCACAAGGEGNG
jgi:hypothetical protein